MGIFSILPVGWPTLLLRACRALSVTGSSIRFFFSASRAMAWSKVLVALKPFKRQGLPARAAILVAAWLFRDIPAISCGGVRPRSRARPTNPGHVILAEGGVPPPT